VTGFLDYARFDLDVRPADDLYRHVNGRWLASTTIPDDRPALGAAADLVYEAEAAIRDICADLAERDDLDPDGEPAKLARLWRSFMDEAAIEARGATGLAGLLERVDALADLDCWRTEIGRRLAEGLPAPFDLSVEPDPADPTRYRLFISQAGLGLPDESYYRQPRQAGLRARYRAYVARLLGLAGGRDQPNAADQAQADAIVELETAIAAGHWDNVRTRDLNQLYNPRSLDQLADEAPGFGWEAIWAAAGVEGLADSVVDCQPSFFSHTAALLTPDRLPAWQAWARFHLVSELAPYLSSRFVEADFDFHGRAIVGQQGLPPRWRRAVGFIDETMGEALGRQYVARHYPARATERMTDLVANLIGAYRQAISALGWMGPTTKAEALRKLDRLRTHIGHPRVWRDYSGLAVGDDLVGNVLAEARFDVAYQLGKLARPVDPEAWEDMCPQTVNAGYDPLRNQIVFPAAILQPPFFFVEADDAVNYGAIGAVIGHEIGHGFDDEGSTCDADGRLRDWWTEQDKQAYQALQQLLIAQYDQLEPAQAPGQHVNGALTLGENIGDLGGLSIAIRAWRRATGGQAELIDGYTGLQRLFFSYAASWRCLTRDEAVAHLLAVDVHAPDEFRCNQVVRNLPDFYEAFGVTESDRAWLDPDQRVIIW
jgi:putative endopeptidase